MNEARFQALETKLAYLERAFEELNQVVYKQSLQLEKITRESQQLNARLRQVLVGDDSGGGGGDGGGQEHQLPPHY